MLDNVNNILTLKGYVKKFPAYTHTNIWHVQKRTNAFYHKKYLYTSDLQQNYHNYNYTFSFNPFFKYCSLLKITFKIISNIRFPYSSIMKYLIYYTNYFHQWGCIKQFWLSIIKYSRCIHIDSRFPVCSDSCKTLINLHGRFWSSDQTIENGGTKQQQQQQTFLDCRRRYSKEQRGNLGWIFIENIYVLFKKINVSNLIYVLKISVHRFSGKSTNLYKIR